MPKYVIERQYLVPMYQHIVMRAQGWADLYEWELDRTPGS